MKQPRIVLDTNVVVSALVFSQGILSELRSAWQSEHFGPLASRDTAEELIRVLHYPRFSLTTEERQELLEDCLPWCENIRVPTGLNVPDCRDPNDRIFLELAIAGRADALVTGDSDIRHSASKLAAPVLTPAQFLGRLA